MLHRKLGMGRLEAAAFGFMMSALMLQWIPSAVQGIYWYNGATHYVLMESIFFFALTALSAAIWARKKGTETAFFFALSPKPDVQSCMLIFS